MPAVVTFNNVSKRFMLNRLGSRSFQDALVNLVHRRACGGGKEEFWALRDVSFKVGDGETIGIIGQNGSGKSTILKLLTRILDPTYGQISVRGRVSALIELGAGFHPDLTGRENIYLNGSILGFSRKQMNARMDDIIAFSELEKFIETPIKHYSSGMQARLGFSVAISVDPDILIIDEVLSVGDESFQQKCLERIDRFRRLGKTIIFVSHSLEQVELLCQRVLWLQDGHLRSDGDSSSLVGQYKQYMQHRLDSPGGPTSSDLYGGIRSISAENGDGLRAELAKGDDLWVRIGYRTGRLATPHSLAIQLTTLDGTVLASADTSLLTPPANHTGERCAMLTLADKPLPAGTYGLRASLWALDSNGVPVESPDYALCRFVVLDGPSRIGCVPDVTWQDARSVGHSAITTEVLSK